MFQYPGSFAYQMPSIARANLQAFLNISGRFASGMQALTELNVRTVQTMVEESNALLRAGDEASPGDVFGWQTVMLAQFPQKAASYGQHVMSIITSTESDVLGEVRSQYERNGITFKDAMESAADESRGNDARRHRAKQRRGARRQRRSRENRARLDASRGLI
jgi:hypothetical protein